MRTQLAESIACREFIESSCMPNTYDYVPSPVFNAAYIPLCVDMGSILEDIIMAEIVYETELVFTRA